MENVQSLARSAIGAYTAVGKMEYHGWKHMDLITTIEGLPPALAASLRTDEKNYIDEIKRRGQLPFGVTPHFASLAGSEADDPVRRQFFPDIREALPDPFALNDPLGEKMHNAAPRLIRQYQDRALLLAGGSCAGYCRHCLRRVWLANAPPFVNVDDKNGELQAALDWLASHSELREILVSGGDPLTADNVWLEKLFSALRRALPDIQLRLCTKVPITNPDRICEKTIALFRQFRPLRIALHLNHPQELADLSRKRLAACIAAEIPVLVQTVLLLGINDDPHVLARLINDCLDLGLTPYYLFQLDLAPGIAHFRVPLERGLSIYRELEKILAGKKLPIYALDLPGGGGKIRLHEDVISATKITEKGEAYLLRDEKGKLWEYPKG